MDEILKNLLESDLLSPESKTAVSTAFKEFSDGYLAEQRQKLENDIRLQLTEEFVKAREELVESVDAKVEAFLEEELAEFVGDVNQFRDLEVEYAEKLVEEKENLSKQFNTEVNTLVDRLDSFLDQRLSEEFTELEESLEEAKRNDFGRRVVEAFEAEFKQFRRHDLHKTEAALAEAQDRLADTESKLASLQRARLAEQRATKIEELLAPLTGSARDQMKILLSNVSATDRLDEAYRVYVGRVLRESVTDTRKQINESAAGNKEKSKFVSGNEVDDQSAVDNHKPSDQLNRVRRLAGLA